ncbi:MAG TPA: AI-2E family transporter [Anaerolineales bacterium]|jgi:predicted PurR-regulated permease PerM|nr:AI-2E family transporter [Anaerolineales bacterium]
MRSKINSSNPSEFVFYAVLIFIVGWLVYTYQVVIGPLIISALIAYLIYPGVTWLSNRTRIHRRRIVLVVYILFLASFVWAVMYLVPVIVNQANLLASQLDNLPHQFEMLQHDLERWLGITLPLEALTADIEDDISQMLKPERAFQFIRRATTNIVWLVVIFITTFHLLRDWAHLREWFFGLLPEPGRSEYRQLHQEIKKVWRSYLRGQLLIMFLLGLFSGIGAALIGLPNALLLGFLAGTLALIPSLGPFLATAIAALVAWTQGSTYLELSNLTVTLLVVVIFVFVQMLEGFYLTPRIMSTRVRLHPGIVMVAIVSTLFTLGALISVIIVPIIASLILVARFVRRKRAGLDLWPLTDSLERTS